MTVREVTEQLDLAMNELQSLNVVTYPHRELAQKKINKAYSILDKLKSNLKK